MYIRVCVCVCVYKLEHLAECQPSSNGPILTKMLPVVVVVVIIIVIIIIIMQLSVIMT